MKPAPEKTASLTLDYDADPDAHLALTAKIFSRQVTGLTVDALVVEQGDD